MDSRFLHNMVLSVSIVIFNLTILTSTLVFSYYVKKYILFLLGCLSRMLFGERVCRMYFYSSYISSLDEPCIYPYFLASYYYTLSNSSTTAIPTKLFDTILPCGFIYSSRGALSVIYWEISICIILVIREVCAIFQCHG